MIKDSIVNEKKNYPLDNNCELCSINSDDIIYNEESNTYQLIIETGEWDYYYDRFAEIYIDIRFCPFCGRKLNKK